jgi:phosphonate transport system substrate-binding protein
MSEATKPRFSFLNIILPAGLFLAGVWLGITIERNNPTPIDPTLTTPVALALGSGSPALAEGYVDANGDLIADAPTDPSKLVDPDVIYFSWLGVKGATKEFKPAFQGFMDHLAKTTGKRVEFVEIENQADQLQAFKDGKLHLTCFNTGAVPEAVREAGFVPLVQPSHTGGQSGYSMQIIVPASSTASKMADLKGKTIYFTTQGSNSGFKAPLVILNKEFGLHAPENFTYKFSGGHEASIVGVSMGEYQAAAIADSVLKRMIAKGFDAKDVKAIYTSSPFPQAVLGIPNNLKPEVAQKLKAGILDFDFKESGLDKALNETGFTPVDYKSQWATIREIDQAFGGAR